MGGQGRRASVVGIDRRSGGLLLLVCALALAGCPGDAGDATTVAPAPVPEAPTVPATPTPECAVQTPAPPSGPTPAPPAGPATVPTANGTVDADAVAARHDAALADRRYRRSAPSLLVEAAPNRSAVRVRATTSVTGISHYVVDGRHYSFYFNHGGGGDRYRVSEYAGGALDSPPATRCR